MRYWEIISEEGLVVPGVNTTQDVKAGEITRQAAKMGFNVDANGIPPLITGGAAKPKRKRVRESVGDEDIIDWHLSGPELAIIDMIEVPAEQRGQGLARIAYEQWEAALPKEVKLVRLWAIGPSAAEFWQHMGYEYQYTCNSDDLDDFHDDDIWLWLWKGVNGHPTPETIWLVPEDSEDLDESVNGAGTNFFWKIPLEFQEMIRSWPVASKSPYSNSYYNVLSGQKTWTNTPEGSLRIADHWNFTSRNHGGLHCPTDRPVANSDRDHGRSVWALGQWENGRYKILKVLPGRKIWELSDEEATRLPRHLKDARERIRAERANMKAD